MYYLLYGCVLAKCGPTAIPCKLSEHIIVSKIWENLNNHGIITSQQHFWRGSSVFPIRFKYYIHFFKTEIWGFTCKLISIPYGLQSSSVLPSGITWQQLGVCSMVEVGGAPHHSSWHGPLSSFLLLLNKLVQKHKYSQENI